MDFLGVSSAAAILEVSKRGLPVPQVGRVKFRCGECAVCARIRFSMVVHMVAHRMGNGGEEASLCLLRSLG